MNSSGQGSLVEAKSACTSASPTGLAAAWHRVFFPSAATVLLLTGLLKLLSALQETKILARPDPVLLVLSIRQTSFIAALLEIAVGMALLRTGSAMRKIALVLWLSGILVSYRLALWLIRYGGACSCLGDVSDWLGLPREWAEWTPRFVLGYLIAGGLLCLALE